MMPNLYSRYVLVVDLPRIADWVFDSLEARVLVVHPRYMG
jgi:hypothetical protein